MDDCCNKKYNNGLFNSSSYIIHKKKDPNDGKEAKDPFSSHPLGGSIQAKRVEEISLYSPRQVTALKKSVGSLKNQATSARITTPIRTCLEPYCQVKLDSLNELKDSTKKLLYLLEDIQSKTYSKDLPPQDFTEVLLVKPDGMKWPSVNDDNVDPALKKLEAQTKTLNSIYIEDDDDDCSIFKRLTRKCHCLNQQEYNDFIIHFNEDTKYFTSTIGEIIKNMRILKKFLYMGGRYTQNALTFLNEGLADSGYVEKVEITQGCSHADVCNVFEDHSIVIMCISWPFKLEYYGDSMTQSLAASFISKLAQMEEGRRYLKFTSRITNDIKKVLRKKGSRLDMDTVESLNAALNVLHPPMTQNSSYLKHTDEAYGAENIKALKHYRQYMTLDEIFTHLDLLHNLSIEDHGKKYMTSVLPSLLILFKQMLKEYDNSEMNIIVTDILNNIVSTNMLKPKENTWPRTVTVAHTATESIKMRNEMVQMPPPPPSHKKSHTKKASNKSKSHVGPTKFRQASRRKVSEYENPIFLNRSRKFTKDGNTHIIVVPIENK
nr:uncharacterized protein LOC110370282 [Helicoverpa armigera]